MTSLQPPGLPHLHRRRSRATGALCPPGPPSSHLGTTRPPAPAVASSALLPSCPSACCGMGPSNPAWRGSHEPLTRRLPSLWTRQIIRPPGSTARPRHQPCLAAHSFAGTLEESWDAQPPRTPAPWREPPGPGLASSVQPPGAVGDVSRMQEPRVHGPREQGCFPSPHPRFSNTESSPLHILELVRKSWLFPSWSRVSALYKQDLMPGDGVSCPRLFPGRASWGHSHTSAMWAWTGRGSAPAWPCLPGGCAQAWNHTHAVPRMLSVSLRGSLQTLLSSPCPSPAPGDLRQDLGRRWESAAQSLDTA